MLIIEDVLLKVIDKSIGGWSFKQETPLAITYRELRRTLGNGNLYMSPSHSGGCSYGRKNRSSKNMVVMCKNERILKELNHSKYIYLSPVTIFMETPLLDRSKYEYVAILKKAGCMEYSVLILGFESLSYDFESPGYELYGGECGLMEILSDGTSVLFERTVSWEELKECKVNTTSIRDLFFNKEEVKLIASVVEDAANNHSLNKNEIYTYRHEDNECKEDIEAKIPIINAPHICRSDFGTYKWDDNDNDSDDVPF